MKAEATTGVPEIDRLAGGIIPGDNIVWEVDSGVPVERFVVSFLAACAHEKSLVIYVSFNSSPQTITNKYASLLPKGDFVLVDCFSSGKGNNDRVFLDFFKTTESNTPNATVHLENPSDPGKLEQLLIKLGTHGQRRVRYIFDSLTGMLDLWGDEESVVRLFGHICPRLYDLNTIACWILEKGAHSPSFLAKIRHITQVVFDVAVSRGVHTLTIRKASNRRCEYVGIPQQLILQDGTISVAVETREGRELGLLTRMGEVLGSALDPNSFFEQTMKALANELGMVRGTIVLLDKTCNRLKIVAAHGLSDEEQSRGQYAIGEGITGQVVKTGVAEIIPDIGKNGRFLNRTIARKNDIAGPIAFICVPLKVDDEIVGALSVDRPFAFDSALQKDLRMLSIVATIVSQVLKINSLIRVEKEEILDRDQGRLRELRSRYRLDNVIGESEAIRKVMAMAATAAKSRASILVTGETGTGKELVAKVVHYNSARTSGPLIKVNCGALPEDLLESELFGHVKGAFTGALHDRKGRFEMADGGTLFLDEIGEMSPRLQVKLLRVLQEREFEPVGSPRTVAVNVRVVTATSKDLREEVRKGRFREDLYYRLNVIPIHLPPLRERREDIPLLINHFLEIFNRENHKNVRKLSRKVLDILLDYPWPGNVRELENCMERVVVMIEGDALSADLLPSEILDHDRQGSLKRKQPSSADILDIRAAAERLCAGTNDLASARILLLQTMEEVVIRHGLLKKASQRDLANKLGISRMTLRKKLQSYDLK
ncbi:MAG: sigma 54-interacting transcriptional regulator [Kiritimatiellae bacterium]|nr:sigma 54-interacting transcriptional regulator [Kiritimatiellia bacterium]